MYRTLVEPGLDGDPQSIGISEPLEILSGKVYPSRLGIIGVVNSPSRTSEGTSPSRAPSKLSRSSSSSTQPTGIWHTGAERNSWQKA